jgi:hypothetical protein
MMFRCWLKDHHGEEDGSDIDAFDAHDAAAEACQEWSDGGTFAGDPIPGEIEVYVRNTANRELFLVGVAPSYSVSFYSIDAKPFSSVEAKPVAEPE